MEIGEISQLLAWLSASDIETLELRRPHSVLRMRMAMDGADAAAGWALPEASEGSDAAAPATPLATASTAMHTVKSQSTGKLLLTHPSHSLPIVQVGAIVKQGDVLALLQVGPLYLPVKADADGELCEVLGIEGATVGYGERLFNMTLRDSRME